MIWQDDSLSKRGGSRWFLLFATAIVVVFIIIIRVRLLDVPLERDEGEYAYIGQLILQGEPPYRLAYSMKFPGTHVAYALIMSIFGETRRGIHMGLLLVNLATIGCLFLLGKRMFDDIAATGSASAYAILSLSPNVMGVFAHATHFVVLPMIAGVLLIFKAIKKGGRLRCFLPGGLLGMAFIMKQNGFFFVLFGTAWLTMEILRKRIPNKDKASPVIWYVFGAILPFALTCLVIALTGTFQKFWFWTHDYAQAYVSIVPVRVGVHLFSMSLVGVTSTVLAILIFPLIGLNTPFWDIKRRHYSVFMYLFVFFSFLAISPGFYFRLHYYVMVLPAIALLSGAALSVIYRRLGMWKAGSGMVVAIVFIISLLSHVYSERNYYFKMSTREVSRLMHGTNPFPEAFEIASWIVASSLPEDRVAVLGSEPEIFFYSRRHSATRYIYMYSLTEQQPFASLMQREAIGEIEASQPKLIIFINHKYSSRLMYDSDIFRWISEYVEAHYNRVGVVDLISNTETAYLWGEEAKSYQPRSPEYIYLFKRKEG